MSELIERRVCRAAIADELVMMLVIGIVLDFTRYIKEDIPGYLYRSRDGIMQEPIASRRAPFRRVDAKIPSAAFDLINRPRYFS